MLKVAAWALAGLVAVGGAIVLHPGFRKWVATRQGTAWVMGVAGYEATKPASVSAAHPSCAERLRWVQERLASRGLTLGDVADAARKQDLPHVLLATVVLGELADYGWTDEFQDQPPFGLDFLRFGKNYGLSQLDLSRARRHMPGSSDEEVERCLLTPRCALDLAAAELRLLADRLADMADAGSSEWAAELLLSPYPDSAREFDVEEARFLQWAYAATGAYNNPDIIDDWVVSEHGHPHFVSGSRPEDHRFAGTLTHAQNGVDLFAKCFLDAEWREVPAATRLVGDCRGSVRASRASGYIGEPVTFIVQIERPESGHVERVVTSNPSCVDCVATRQSEGRYALTLHFEGNGPWRLDFVAYGRDGRQMCSGSSSTLSSLGER